MARGLSLHIGLNDVDPTHFRDEWKKLDGAEFDAVSMAELAGGQGFDADSLIAAEATRDRVIDQIRSAAGTLVEGDLFLLTYAAHGSRVRDVNGDEKDRMDETWCLYDGMLLDDEQSDLYTEFAPGVRILVVSDSCHSGTVTRGAPPEPAEGSDTVFRHMPRSVERQTWLEHKDLYNGIQTKLQEKHGGPIPAPRATVQLLAACKDDQLAADGSFNGFFTESLLEVWNGGQFDGTYESFAAEISALMEARAKKDNVQVPNHTIYGQSVDEFRMQRPFTIG